MIIYTRLFSLFVIYHEITLISVFHKSNGVFFIQNLDKTQDGQVTEAKKTSFLSKQESLEDDSE